MRIPYYHVDAFTGSIFSGNPAGVCPLPRWLPDALLQSIAAENNLSETAFFTQEAGPLNLRWFTPALEVDLCGHATLAAAHHGTTDYLHVFDASSKGQIAEAVAIAPNGKSLVTGSWDRSLKLWDLGSGKVVREMAGHTASVQNAVFSPDGRILASSDAEGTVRLWKAETGESITELKAHSDRCFGLAFSPDGKHRATAAWDRLVKIWDVETWKPTATLQREKH
jgi:WD40 repeat protein